MIRKKIKQLKHKLQEETLSREECLEIECVIQALELLQEQL